MKFYSEVTKKLYNTAQDLLEAEKQVKEEEAKRNEAERIKKEERATRAKEVEKALKEANEAQSKAIKLINDFTKDYGFFHMSLSNKDENNECIKVYRIACIR